MDRLLVVRCPDLLDEDEDGDALRSFTGVVAAVEAYCPWVTVVRPGVCSLPVRGPARYFGGEQALVGLVHRAATGVDGAGATVGVGVADGLFAAVLAAGAGVVVPAGGTPGFLAPLPVAVLGDDDLADLLARLGVRTLGDFAGLPERHVLGRFGAHGVACHRVAGGRSGELDGLRKAGCGPRVEALRRGTPEPVRQSGFWGGMSDADARAARALDEVQRLLGPGAVATAHLQGGRAPGERTRLVTWGGAAVEAGDPGAPWPGRIPPPAPVLVHGRPRRAEVADAGGGAVAVSGRGLLSADPARLSVEGGPWQAVEAWAGPWPSDDRWWSRAHRRSARMQVVAADGTRLLLVERGRWWVEATYG